MTFKMGETRVRDIIWGDETSFKDGVLTLNAPSLVGALNEKAIKGVKVHIAKPGDSTRIVCVKDVIEPRTYARKWGWMPHALRGLAIVTCGQIVCYQEGIIDMSGVGAQYSAFAKTMNIVLDIDVIDGISQHEHERVLRCAGNRAASYIGFIFSGLTPEKITEYKYDPQGMSPKLPKVAYVYMLLTQGLMHDTYIYGRNGAEDGVLPRTMLPKEIVCGNVIRSGNCVSACNKNTTYHHQNNPVVMELLNRNGQDLNFVGVVLTSERTKLEKKQEAAREAVAQVLEMGAEAVVISKEGFGNPDADLMMLIRGFEQAGIKTVCITDEFAGSDGCSQSLADTTKEATSVVSTGNANELIVLPPMDIVIGPIKDLTKLAGAYPQSLRQDGSLQIELQGIIGATNQIGFECLSCKEV